jgi:hypothetical protein
MLLHRWEGREGGEEHGGMRDYANAWAWGNHTKTLTSASCDSLMSDNSAFLSASKF